jgi:hypothetical protein
MKRGFAVFALALGTSLAVGCGSGDPPKHPDTGAGAGQPVPATLNCADFCQRAASCTATLCDEDTHSTQYDSLVAPTAAACAAGCNDAQIQAAIPTSAWQCIFQSSCREAFDYNTCGATSTKYSC